MRCRALIFSFLFVLTSAKKDPNPDDVLAQVECETSDDGYLIPDPEQCDRYAECTASGKLVIQLCKDGYALDLNNGKCDLISKVDCKGREKQQAPTGSGLCPRLNGYFPVPAEISCSEYVDCREGQPFMQSCGHGAVFDEIDGCVHPDQTTRPGCTATDVFGYKCPLPTGDRRFGDHERHPHPTDCAYFYACLNTGQPRLLGCTKPTVFNPETGLCDKPELVKGCEDYYPPGEEEEELKEDRKAIEDEIRAELEAKYGLRAGSLDKDDFSSSSKDSSSSSKDSSNHRFSGSRSSQPQQEEEKVEKAKVEKAEPAPQRQSLFGNLKFGRRGL